MILNVHLIVSTAVIDEREDGWGRDKQSSSNCDKCALYNMRATNTAFTSGSDQSKSIGPQLQTGVACKISAQMRIML